MTKTSLFLRYWISSKTCAGLFPRLGEKTFIYVCFRGGCSSGGKAGNLLIGMLIVQFLAAPG